MQSLPGMRDLLPGQTATWDLLHATARVLARKRGYGWVETPILEPTELFQRGVGGDTDVVEKEMYTFTDKGDRSVTLRPEATASAVRAYFDGGLQQATQPVRLYYWGPMFRYDRPQAGRYRQFFQYGVEAIGEASPGVDVEVVELARDWLGHCGLDNVTLELNSLGDSTCRPAYREALRDHFRPHLDTMCADCRRRFDVNPLRLLDCKKPSCTPFQAGAPSPVDYLCEPCRAHYDEVRAQLRELGIAFNENPRLVRGLDYYTRTAFEFWAPDLEGAQNALGGGGRYDGLAAELGYAGTPGVGFAMGVDRVALALERAGKGLPERGTNTWVVPAAPGAERAAQVLARDLRAQGWSATVPFGGRSLKSAMRAAQKAGAACVLILGEEELAAGEVTVRDMRAATQVRLPRENVIAEVDRILNFDEDTLVVSAVLPPPAGGS